MIDFQDDIEWTSSPSRAIGIQKALAGKVIRTGAVRAPRLVGGADLAFSSDKKQCIAGAVVWDLKKDTVVEQHIAVEPVRFPYVPGMLAFREAPAVFSALTLVREEPDVFMFDGHGFAHPRRFGLACYLGLMIDRPSVGCAKSVLVGDFALPGEAKGAQSGLFHHDQQIGTVLRSRDRVKPVFVSVGHRLSLRSAVRITLMCCTRYRLPEPTRLADQLVSRSRKTL